MSNRTPPLVDYLDATLRCTRCRYESRCLVPPDSTRVGDVLDTGECDECAFDHPAAGRTAVVVALAPRTERKRS